MIDNCIFENNTSAEWGGAIFHMGGHTTITNSVFTGNTAQWGGAISTMSQQDLLIEGCVFANNTADSGGAISADFANVFTLKSCTLVGNEAAVGSGIWFNYGQLLTGAILKTVITDGVGGAAIEWDGEGTLAVACTDLHDNEGGDWIDFLTGYLGVDGNLSVDPLYCGAQNPDDPWSLDASSPCLAVGDCGRIGARDSGCDLTDVPATPRLARLRPCAPNPFNPKTTIAFDLAREAKVSLAVFDAAGRYVRTLIGGDIRADGYHAVTWDGTDDDGRGLAAGVYLCRLKAGSVTEIGRMTLIK